MTSALPPLGWHALFTTWHVRPLWTIFVVGLLTAYLLGLRQCRRAGVRAVSPWRVAAFVNGLVVLGVTVSSAIDVYAMAVFWMHMVEHLLLIMVVPALLVLGHPLTLLRAAAETSGSGARIDRWLQEGPVMVLTHPLVGLGVYTAVIVGTHLTSFMDAMHGRPWLMGAEQVLYVGAGYLLLLPLVGDEPIRWRLPHLGRLMLLLVAMTPDTVVGIVLLQTLSDPFPAMENARPTWAPDPMRDIDIAGGVMWAYGDGLMMLLGLGVIIAMIRVSGRTNTLGPRLEGVRRQTMATHAAPSATGSEGAHSDGPFSEGVDVDDDEDVLAAYNRMLGRLSRGH